MRVPARRRLALVLGVLLAGSTVAIAPSPVVAAECPAPLKNCIVVSVVKTVDGKRSTIKQYTVGADDVRTWAANDPELQQRRYGLRKNPESRGGKLTTRASTAKGSRVSVNALLSYLDPDLSGKARFLETPNASGVPAVLSDADMSTPPREPSRPTPTPTAPTTAPPGPTPSPSGSSPSPDDYPFIDELPPTVFLAGNGQFGYIRPLRDDEDTNFSDYFRVAGRLDLTINTTGRLLQPTVTSSAGTALDTKKSTTFSVSFATKPGTRIKSTRWDFGDGSTQGTSRDEPSKAFTKRGTFPVVVTVRGNNGSYGRSAPLQIKVANPPKAPANGSGGGTGLGGNGGGGGGSTNYIPPPFTPPADDFEAPDDFEDVPEEDPEPQIPVDDGLEPVEGYVLAGAEIVPGGTPESIPGTEDSTPAAATQESLRKRAATWAVAAFALALLVGLGAASETRWLQDRLRHLRRRA